MKDFTLVYLQKLFIRTSLTLILSSWFINYAVSGQGSTVKEEDKSILTYPCSDPDSVPSLDINTFEQYFLNPASENLTNFKFCIRNELPYDTCLELAIEYVNEGQNAEAIRVLEQSSPYPVVFYWLAWLNRTSSPGKSSEYLKKAEDMSPYLVFPFRLESIPVFTWAMDQHDFWKTKYYLGLIYWHILRPEKALGLFEQCGDIPDHAPFYLARAILFQNSEREYCMPCNDYSQAVSLGPEDWRTWHFLSNFLQIKGAFQEQLNNSKEAYSHFPANPVIANDYAKALLNLKNENKHHEN